MNEGRVHAGCAIMNGKIYVCGGEGDAPAPHERKGLKSVECFDPDTNTWKECASMLQARYQFGFCVLPPVTAHKAGTGAAKVGPKAGQKKVA